MELNTLGNGEAFVVSRGNSRAHEPTGPYAKEWIPVALLTRHDVPPVGCGFSVSASSRFRGGRLRPAVLSLTTLGALQRPPPRIASRSARASGRNRAPVRRDPGGPCRTGSRCQAHAVRAHHADQVPKRRLGVGDRIVGETCAGTRWRAAERPPGFLPNAVDAVKPAEQVRKAPPAWAKHT